MYVRASLLQKVSGGIGWHNWFFIIIGMYYTVSIEVELNGGKHNAGTCTERSAI